MGYKKIKNIVKKLVLVISVLMMIALLLPGCTDTLKGELNPNQQPIVEFVNIPPDGQNFSRNAEVYWVGYDNDGQIDYYRYYVANESEFTGTPLEYAQSLDDSEWIYIDVSPTESDPKTTNVIPLTADINDPVNTFVGQYIFLQAFDVEGASSEIVYKLLFRNDNPPETKIMSIASRIPYVNSAQEGGIITGVKIEWEGSDVRDYEEIGLIPPPFEYEWRLYGPFSSVDSAKIYNELIKYVYVTEDARIFDIGDTLITCDTALIDNGGTTVIEETCDTVIFSSNTPNTPFYTKDTVLLVDDELFTANLVTNSQMETGDPDGWIYATGDTIFNVYRNFQSDTTVQKTFVFWVRSRDDAYVADVTPEFKTFPVIDPHYERTIIVVDFTVNYAPFLTTYVKPDTAKAFWYNIIHHWFDSYGSSINGEDSLVFDTTRLVPASPDATSQDYLIMKYAGGKISISTLLKHKMMILYNENVFNSGFVAPGNSISNPQIFQAIDAKVNVWATWRAPILGDLNNPKDVTISSVPGDYRHYFGVEEVTYSAWFNHAFGLTPNTPAMRIEDFIGAYSLDESQWPKLDIDTALLHSRFMWGNTFGPIVGWIDTVAALPEVDWAVRSFGTEVMYLYQSKYGSDHPLGFDLSFEGSPIAHRKKTNLFKTVHFMFTPMCLKSDQAYEISNEVLTWLYPEDDSLATSPISENRYDDANVYITLDQARKINDERNNAKTDPGN